MDSNLGKLSCSCECGTSFDYHIPLGYGELNIHCPICKKYVETVEITGDVYSRKISVSKNVGIKLDYNVPTKEEVEQLVKENEEFWKGK